LGLDEEPDMSTTNIRCRSCEATNRVRADRLADARCGRCKEALRPAHPLELDDQAFDALSAQAELPILLDLWSPTCGPCLRVAPDVARLAEQYEGKLLVAKIDVSRHPGVAQRLGVRGVPTFAVFQGGQPVSTQVGAMPLPQLQAFVAPYVAA
jgi:thioredoxin 2